MGTGSRLLNVRFLSKLFHVHLVYCLKVVMDNEQNVVKVLLSVRVNCTNCTADQINLLLQTMQLGSVSGSQ